MGNHCALSLLDNEEFQKSVLAIPASSSKSERTFLKGGLIVTPLRQRLQPDLVEDLIVLSTN